MEDVVYSNELISVEEQVSDIVLSMVLSILHFGPYGQDDVLGMKPEKEFLQNCYI